MDTRNLYGRRIITTDADVITSKNVVAELEKAMYIHTVNREEIAYLWNYYKGKQPILYTTGKKFLRLASRHFATVSI